MKKAIIILLFGTLFSCQLGEKRAKRGDNHLAMGVSLLKNCKNQQALSHLLKAADLKKKDPLTQHTLSLAYYALGKYSLAEEVLKRTLKINSKLAEPRVTLAKVYLEREKPGRALKELSLAEKNLTYPGYFKIVSLRGEAYFKRKNWIQAKKWFTEADKQTSESGRCFTYTHLGRAEFELRNYHSAVTFLNKAAVFCQKRVSPCKKQKFHEQYFLAQSYIKLGQKSRSKYHLKIFLKRVDKSDPLFLKAQNLLKTLKKSS